MADNADNAGILDAFGLRFSHAAKAAPQAKSKPA